MPKKFENAEQTAERLGVTKNWIWEKARSGEMPAAKIGKYYFFDPVEVDSWIKKNEQGAN